MINSNPMICEGKSRLDYQQASLLGSAICCASRSLDNFEVMSPCDTRPRHALVAASVWAVNPTHRQLSVVEYRMADVALSLVELDRAEPGPEVVAAECAAMAVELVGFTIAEPDDLWWPAHVAIDAATSVAFAKCPVVDERWFAAFWEERRWQEQHLIGHLWDYQHSERTQNELRQALLA